MILALAIDQCPRRPHASAAYHARIATTAERLRRPDLDDLFDISDDETTPDGAHVIVDDEAP